MRGVGTSSWPKPGTATWPLTRCGVGPPTSARRVQADLRLPQLLHLAPGGRMAPPKASPGYMEVAAKALPGQRDDADARGGDALQPGISGIVRYRYRATKIASPWEGWITAMAKADQGTRGEPDAVEAARPVRRAGRGDGPAETLALPPRSDSTNKMLGIVGASVASVTFAREGIVVGLHRRRRRPTWPCGWRGRGIYDRRVRRWRHLDLAGTNQMLAGGGDPASAVPALRPGAHRGGPLGPA